VPPIDPYYCFKPTPQAPRCPRPCGPKCVSPAGD
jgi:hypothetical protein